MNRQARGSVVGLRDRKHALGAEPLAGARLALVGLGAIGWNLARNAAGRGIPVVLWDRDERRLAEVKAQASGEGLRVARSGAELLSGLAAPRRVLLAVPAPAVEDVIRALEPWLAAGDIVVDAGNSFFRDSERRAEGLARRGIGSLAVGLSGGARGARWGPSLMVGGDPRTYSQMEETFREIAAATDEGPAVARLGPVGSAHFVKMVHNGIEYAHMQLIAEVYDILSCVLGRGAEELAEIFDSWSQGPLASFLLEITARIFRRRDPETGRPLVELVLDEAGQKGTGRWAVEAALELGVPVPTIDAAVAARLLSAQRSVRLELGSCLDLQPRGTAHLPPAPVDRLHHALHLSQVLAFAQGLHLVTAASAREGWGVPLAEVVRVLRGGSILRCAFLDTLLQVYRERPDLKHLLLHPEVQAIAAAHHEDMRRVVSMAQGGGVPVPCLSSSLAYLDGYRRARLPQNLTQAQRDAFGAHGYRRRDRPGAGRVHTDWLEEGDGEH